MNPEQVKRFNGLYQRHSRLLTLQGKSQKTIDAYCRAIRRIRDYFDCLNSDGACGRRRCGDSDRRCGLFVNNLPWLADEPGIRLCDRSLATAVVLDES